MEKRVAKRVLLLACILFAMSLLLSFALAAEHSGHCCHPKRCVVCRQIDVMRNLIKLLALAFNAALGLKHILLHSDNSREGQADFARPRTLVRLRVRMNN